VVLVSGSAALAQTAIAPTNAAPNPYTTVENFFKMPEGRVWGALSAVEIDKDGKSVWVGERCGANSCWDAAAQKMVELPVILKFDETGKLVRSFATGMMVFPHGFHIDADGNVWITDGNDNLPRRAQGAAADAPLPPMPAKVIGHQVFKFSPEGKLLLTLGKPGGNRPGQPADPASFFQPNDVITNAKGEIFVAEGHGGDNARIVKFDKTGKFIKAWGSYGSGPGQMDQPHGLAWDSKGRLFVADRSNNRLLVFDQEGTLLESGYEQFSRNSGIWIDKNDMLFASDSESGSVNLNRKNWKRGIRIGSLREGPNAKVIALIPDSAVNPTNTSGGEGVAVDAAGNIYGAEVGQRALKKYVKK
jgi:sugar lactone lactonase YvrE